MSPAIYSLGAFFGTVLLLWVGRSFALRYGFADKPGGRKKHENPVPPIGGLAILPVFVLGSWLAGLHNIVPWPLMSGLAILLVMGAIDDAHSLKPFLKFAIMVWTACFVVIFGEAQIGQLGNLFGFGLVELGICSKAFTVMCLVLLMNAVNMLDGVDGLAGGFCALVAFWMIIVCAGAEQWESFWALSILLAALLGFLFWNMRSPFRKRASVFLGDAGSLCLGLLLGWFSIKLTQGESAPLEPVTVIWIIAIPVMDAFALFIARSARGKHPFNADRLHLHHRFLDAGVGPGRTCALILGMIAFTALIGFVSQAYHLPPVLLFAVWMAVFVAHIAGIMHPRGYRLFSLLLRVRSRNEKRD